MYFGQSRDREGALEFGSQPLIYLITFACYGSHLHTVVETEVPPERVEITARLRGHSVCAGGEVVTRQASMFYFLT
jgi:hypothetical protein